MSKTVHATKAGIQSSATTGSRRTIASLRSPVLALAVLALVMAPGATGTRVVGLQAPQGSNPTNTAKPLVNRFFVLLAHITQLRATRADGTLVVRYLARVEGMINGKPYTPGPAPRLSVFVWNGKRWQLAAHANFNPLTG
jgi:hypothetical protein